MRPLVPIVLALCACAPAAPPAPTFHKDVEPIIQTSCQSCHLAGGIGPFPLDTFVAWADAPVEGNPADAPVTRVQKPGLSQIDAELKMKEAYTPAATLTDD